VYWLERILRIEGDVFSANVLQLNGKYKIKLPMGTRLHDTCLPLRHKFGGVNSSKNGGCPSGCFSLFHAIFFSLKLSKLGVALEIGIPAGGGKFGETLHPEMLF
jgi:hypothetical protein